MSTRREFITLLGGAAVAWPLAASAQQPAIPVVGFMSSGSPGPLRRQMAAVREGLREAGYVDGQNVAIEFRFAEGQSGPPPGGRAHGHEQRWSARREAGDHNDPDCFLCRR